MRLAGPFHHNQTKDNLIHLKEGQIVGEWRDSTYGKSTPWSLQLPERTETNSQQVSGEDAFLTT